MTTEQLIEYLRSPPIKPGPSYALVLNWAADMLEAQNKVLNGHEKSRVKLLIRIKELEDELRNLTSSSGG